MPDYMKTLEEELLLHGRLFTVDAGVNGQLLEILLDNPSDSGINIIALTAKVTHETDITVTVYDQVSNVSGGTDLDAENNFIGHPRTEDANVVRDPTYSGDNEQQSISYIGQGTRKLFEGDTLALQPGESMLIRMEDDGGSNQLTDLKMAWGEIKQGTYT